jgi:nitrite reductase (NADH) large subunit
LLLVLLVPARRFLFNTDGIALAAVIVAVALLALALGAFFAIKAGFCNAICPVLPVERLYGQSPLLRVGNARCETCSSCTQRGCIDLGPEKSIQQTLGSDRQGTRWLRSGFGIFAAAFPGFVIGYYTTTDVPLNAAGSVYLHILLYAAISYLSVSVAVYLFKPVSAAAFVVLGAVAAGLYYWFAVEVVLTAFGVAGLWPMIGRALALLVVGIWLVEALPKALPRGVAEGQPTPL